MIHKHLKDKSYWDNKYNKPFKEVNDIGKVPVDPEVWAASKRLFAQRTLRLALRVPEAADAVQAEVVSTWDGDGVGVDVQTDAAMKLPLKRHGGHFPDWKKTWFYSNMYNCLEPLKAQMDFCL